MCGLAGIAPSSVHRLPEIKRLQLMGGTIAHRGPDDAGVYVTPGIGLASRRLSILDLSPSGHMPMVTRDGRYAIAYNGEVYNFREIWEKYRRTQPADYGSLRSATDTEVLLNLLAARGPSILLSSMGCLHSPFGMLRRGNSFSHAIASA